MVYGRRGRNTLVSGVESEFVGFYLPKYLREKLGDEADSQHISLSHMLRNIICDFLDEEYLDGDIKRANNSVANIR